MLVSRARIVLFPSGCGRATLKERRYSCGHSYLPGGKITSSGGALAKPTALWKYERDNGEQCAQSKTENINGADNGFMKKRRTGRVHAEVWLQRVNGGERLIPVAVWNGPVR